MSYEMSPAEKQHRAALKEAAEKDHQIDLDREAAGKPREYANENMRRVARVMVQHWLDEGEALQIVEAFTVHRARRAAEWAELLQREKEREV